jgi:tol-pal system protein YbgF
MQMAFFLGLRAMKFRFAVRMMIVSALLAGGLSSSLAQEDNTEPDNTVRIIKLETVIRQLSGQIEELQFANRKLEDQIKQMQTGGATQASPATTSPAPAKTTATESNAGPIDLMAAAKGGTPAAPSGTLAAQAANAKTPPAPAEPAAPKDAKSDFTAAKSLFRSGDYAGSANALKQFLQTWPKDPSVTDAILLLGDAEYRQKRYPEAAQQYLKIAQATPVSPSAPVAFAKLGDALVSMGQKPQACATFAEFGKRFSDAEFGKRFSDAEASLKARVEKAKTGAGC